MLPQKIKVHHGSHVTSPSWGSLMVHSCCVPIQGLHPSEATFEGQLSHYAVQRLSQSAPHKCGLLYLLVPRGVLDCPQFFCVIITLFTIQCSWHWGMNCSFKNWNWEFSYFRSTVGLLETRGFEMRSFLNIDSMKQQQTYFCRITTLTSVRFWKQDLYFYFYLFIPLQKHL